VKAQLTGSPAQQTVGKVDDVHFLDISRRDGREVANHFKWLANVFPVTFLFAGVGLRARGLLDEGLSGADAVFSQTARR
jgi:hypothetical protein